jgi:predicted O-methyltransferase YrrM
MAEQIVVNLLKKLLPQSLYLGLKKSYFRRMANSLQNRLSSLPSLTHKVDFTLTNYYFPSQQKRTEIVRLLEAIQILPTRRLLEIGAKGGGTLALFAQAATDEAQILSLDLDYSDHRLYSHPQLARHGQRIVCIQADTHCGQSTALVQSWLSAEQIDVLFIDGDHSYEGVKQDYEMYSPFVRSGGHIVIHDIQQDYLTRYGRPTSSITGGVPQFWLELKTHNPRAIELIEDPEQDGMGIGIIRVT